MIHITCFVSRKIIPLRCHINRCIFCYLQHSYTLHLKVGQGRRLFYICLCGRKEKRKRKDFSKKKIFWANFESFFLNSTIHLTACTMCCKAAKSFTLMILRCIQAGQQQPLTDCFARVHHNMRDACVRVSHEWVNIKRKLNFHSVSGSGCKMLLSLDVTSLPPGAFDQRVVHQFTGRVEVLQLLSFTLTSFFSLARFLSPALVSLSASRLTALSSLLWRDPSATLMKRQVLCDSASPVGVTRCRDDGSGAGQ